MIDYELEPWKIVTDGDYSRIVTENMDYASTSGAPLLPYDEFKIGIPPSGDVSYRILSSESSNVNLPARLIPVPEVGMIEGLSNYNYQIKPELYSVHPAEIIQKLLPVTFRGLGFVPIVVNPFSYDGDKGLKILSKASIEINLSGDIRYKHSETTDPAKEVLLGQLINAQQAQNWFFQTRPSINFAPFGSSDWWLRVETNREGIYRLNSIQLSELPLQDIDPRSIRMFSTSGKVLDNSYSISGSEFREIPIMISGETDGSFDADDYILFYGSSRDSYDQNIEVQTEALYYNPYSQNQVFWLTFGSNFNDPPLRISISQPDADFEKGLQSTPEVTHVESESQRREDTGFTWYSSKFFGTTTAEYQLQTTLSDVDLAGEQNLSFRIRQEDIGSSLLHVINVEVNGVPVYSNPITGALDFTWAGTSAYIFSRSINNLVSGTNLIKIKVLRSYTDNLLFDWYRLSYRQNLEKGQGQKAFTHPTTVLPVSYRFNLSGNLDNTIVLRANGIYNVDQIPIADTKIISNGTSSTRYFMLNPSEAFIPALVQVVEPLDLTANTEQSDNIIITPAEFISQAQILAQKYWDVYQVKSRVILQDDVFAQFNGGHPDPAAFRQMLRYFFHNLPAPKISSLTLIGLGTIDWRNYSGSAAAKNKIITWQGDYVLSDDYFAMLNTDLYPELGVGRYPVKNTTELDIMMQNFTNYTANPTPGWWRNSMVFLGDDLNNGSSTYEYIHTQQTEEAANAVHPSIAVDRIFALEYDYDEFQNKPRARDDMFAAINQGRLLWYYVGHGSFDKLGSEDYLNGATDMGRFTNHGKLPFFMASSCKVSHFDYWGFESLGQKVVLMNDLGAIASYSATRLSYPDNNHPMAMNLLKNLANGRNSLGYSIMDAKIRYTGSNSNDAVYVLLGDPVLKVVPPERDSTMQITGANKKGVLHSRETALIEGSFSNQGLSGETEIKAFSTRNSYSLGPSTTVSHSGPQLFKGKSDVLNSQYNAGFIVPDDISNGNSGLVVSYFWDAAAKKDYTNYYYPLSLSDQAINVENTDAPQINLYLGTLDFRAGDTVGTNTTLYANISDANGINITGSSGHNILLVIDNALQPISITDYFSYDKGSYTKGSLAYPLNNLSVGPHTIQVIAFDNFNQPSVATTSFVAKKSGDLSLERLLIYPNPISQDGHITFMLSADAELTLGFYTISGKRIRNIKANGREGFNKVFWDGKDEQGNRLANNTYFVKVKAKAATGKTVEKTEKLVVFK